MDNSLHNMCGTVVGLVLFYSMEGLHGGVVRAISVCTVAETFLTRFKLFMEQKRLEHGERERERVKEGMWKGVWGIREKLMRVS